jgi:ketosteroid isomerase-like protein
MHRLLTATGVALFLTASVASAQPAGAARPTGVKVINDAGTSAAEAAVRSAELARFKAMTAGDYAELGRLLGDDLIYTHSNALVDTKASYVESMTSGNLKYQSIEPRDLEVRVYGDTAVITAAAAITSVSKGQTQNNQLRYTDVWVLRDGRWQMVGWQSTKNVP